MSDIEALLAADVDEAVLARWLSRLALFDWSLIPTSARMFSSFGSGRVAVGPMLALYGLFHPLLDLRPMGRREGRDLLTAITGARTPATARRLTAVMRGGDVERALDIARSRYAMARVPLMRMDARWEIADAERLLAALL